MKELNQAMGISIRWNTSTVCNESKDGVLPEHVAELTEVGNKAVIEYIGDGATEGSMIYSIGFVNYVCRWSLVIREAYLASPVTEVA